MAKDTAIVAVEYE